ncbi:hypothetical protein ACZ87_01450 [Candidatus Erwinia dacicola]|uniref:Uncharacterized protein n=1 Tax=Candidatus Erwinia dacicola TaxID=252393 RepID=A0A328TMD6_9GAMM|nr:hypothetical protein ACZ87_01450 [Candidatus Erwinia dacicola]
MAVYIRQVIKCCKEGHLTDKIRVLQQAIAIAIFASRTTVYHL